MKRAKHRWYPSYKIQDWWHAACPILLRWFLWHPWTKGMALQSLWRASTPSFKGKQKCCNKKVIRNSQAAYCGILISALMLLIKCLFLRCRWCLRVWNPRGYGWPFLWRSLRWNARSSRIIEMTGLASFSRNTGSVHWLLFTHWAVCPMNQSVFEDGGVNSKVFH